MDDDGAGGRVVASTGGGRCRINIPEHLLAKYPKNMAAQLQQVDAETIDIVWAHPRGTSLAEICSNYSQGIDKGPNRVFTQVRMSRQLFMKIAPLLPDGVKFSVLLQRLRSDSTFFKTKCFVPAVSSRTGWASPSTFSTTHLQPQRSKR